MNSPRKGLSREKALAARPARVPPVRTEPLPDGGRKITVPTAPHRWQRWFGAKGQVERSFELDAFGVQVYDQCSGDKTVAEIVDEFAEQYGVSAAEAEMSVTRFLKMLVTKGVIVMGVDIDHGEENE